MSQAFGPQTAFSQQLHAMKYRRPGETFEDSMNRVAFSLSDGHDHYKPLRQILLHQRFMPAGRVQAAIGAGKEVTAFNCLAGDTLVLTQEHGLVEIDSLAGTVATVLDGARQWVQAKFRCFGVQDLYRVTLSHGRKCRDLLATAGHGWISEGRRIETRDLDSRKRSRTRIDFLAVDKSYSDREEYRKGIMHGFVYGDGTAHVDDRPGRSGAETYHVVLCEDKADIRPYFDGYEGARFAERSPSHNQTVLGIYYMGSAWANLKALPRGEDVSDDYLLGFIRGWMAADGCVSTQPEVTLCCGPTEEAWLKLWAEVVGFHVVGSSTLARETNYGKRSKESRNVRFDLRSIQPADLLMKWKRERLSAYRSNDDAWGVKSVSKEPVARKRVYCATVETTNSFALAGGIHSGNCFVSGTIPDSYVNTDNVHNSSIMHRAMEAATTMRMGGGIGYDFSTLRPNGALIQKLQSSSSGPLSFMEIYDAVCRATSSSGHRRGAQMGILRIDHPDVLAFINSKHNQERLTGFNISTAVTNEFMEAVAKKSTFQLRFGGQVYREVDAAETWETLMRSTWDWAEPGVFFVDTVNRMNNLWYCEEIAACNPCGEQPLPPFGACLLGSFNLVKYVIPRLISGEHSFDWDMLNHDIPHVVRAMDNVTDRSKYPLPQQENEAKNKRRMGLGVCGLANAAEALGFPYGSPSFLAFEDRVLATITKQSYLTGAVLAAEKGSFPLYDEERFMAGQFIQTLDDEVHFALRKSGSRCSHYSSIAPTGTISMSADNISSGIEPTFELETQRPVNTPDGAIIVTMKDYGYENFGVSGKVASMVTATEHVDALVTAQRHMDSAVSKTCNVDGTMPWEDFKNIYWRAWENGAKGCTTFNQDGARIALLTGKTDSKKQERPDAQKREKPTVDVVEVGGSCEFDPVTGRRSCE